MLNVVLCGHKTLSVRAGLREDQKLRILEKRVRGDVLFVLRGGGNTWRLEKNCIISRISPFSFPEFSGGSAHPWS